MVNKKKTVSKNIKKPVAKKTNKPILKKNSTLASIYSSQIPLIFAIAMEALVLFVGYLIVVSA